ncbi:MAG: hypothetical protein M1814_001398 [Vezdaea aestivalis]|nr:MAG: hypothetical protein M1814_001398 [Vezdaea aestivalis]
MSQETASAEEAAEVVKILEGIHNRRESQRPSALLLQENARSDSPLGTRSPVRSMLDISVGPSQNRHASIAGTGVGVTNMIRSSSGSGQPPVRSLLDPADETSGKVSKAASPPLLSPNIEGRFYERSNSPGVAPRLLSDRSRASDQSQFSPTSSYQFENPPPKQSARRSSKFSRQSAFTNLLSGGERLSRENERGRHNSIAGTNFDAHKQSNSPSARFGSHSRRSQSPKQGSRLNANYSNMKSDPNKFISSSGQVIDIQNAYRRLSDHNLAKSRGSLASLPSRPGSEHIRVGSGEALSPTGEVRLQKDYYSGDEDALADSSDDSPNSSDEELYGRGRARDRDSKARKTSGSAGSSGGKISRAPKSLLAAAEEERQEISSNYKVRSLLGPDAPASPSGEKLQSKKAGVHPSTSFDHATGSGGATPRDTDTEEEANMDDIRRALRLKLITSPISSSPDRCVRTVTRGEFSRLHKEAQEGLRRQRSYLVATDLSDEAAHALEWTIGTVLRDGDTLLAMFAVDEENGTGVGGETDSIKGTETPKDSSAATEHHAAKPMSGSLVPPATNRIISGSKSEPASPDGRARSKAENERIHATEEITSRIIRLLRKTKLQVRAIIEVIYCQTPKHTICSMIDYVDPTLVVLGSRGRSALKGVLLGSFSNYLVQKSSVPVMVARKRLRKSKYKRPANPRLANNLTSPSGEQGMNLRLSSAKID